MVPEALKNERNKIRKCGTYPGLTRVCLTIEPGGANSLVTTPRPMPRHHVSQCTINCRNDHDKRLASRTRIHLDRVVGRNCYHWHFGCTAHAVAGLREIQSARDHLHQQLQATRVGCCDVRG